MAKLNVLGVPSDLILTLESALNTPQIEHRNTFTEVELPETGKVKMFNLTAKFDKTPGLVETPPPHLSEHTFEILTSIGYSESELEQYKSAGVI